MVILLSKGTGDGHICAAHSSILFHNIANKVKQFAYVISMLHLTNRFHVAVRLFSNRSQMTSKCGKNQKVAHEAQPSVSLMFLPRFDVLCDLLLNRRTETWNLFALYNKNIKIHGKNALLFQISPL